MKGVPLKCASKDKVFVNRQFVEGSIEVPLVDESTSFVDYD